MDAESVDLVGKLESLVSGFLGVVDHGSLDVARNEAAVSSISPIGKALPNHPQPGSPRLRLQGALRGNGDGGSRAVADYRRHDGTGHGGIGIREVIQSSMGLDVAYGEAGFAGDFPEKNQLPGHHGLHHGRGQVQRPPSEVLRILEAGMSSRGDAVALRQSQRRSDGGGIAGMPATSDVDRGGQGDQSGILIGALSQVHVEIDPPHHFRLRKSKPVRNCPR